MRSSLASGVFVRPDNAELRGEVALPRGLAAAVDEYEERPHGAPTVTGAAPS
jgi:hypothetical protein